MMWSDISIEKYYMNELLDWLLQTTVSSSHQLALLLTISLITKREILLCYYKVLV